MKKIKTIFVIIFVIIILTPIANFNFEKDAISNIDNKTLINNPFSKEEIAKGNFNKSNIEAYVNDRIGFREDMILGYTLLNDRIFGEMVHPIYSYGKEGYVFGEGITVNKDYSDYHEDFVNMVKKIQDYCEERNIPFLFVFNPAKPAVLSEYIADGINYDREWVDRFMDNLKAQNINFIDNTELLKKKQKSGEFVFNQKYDANHWNSLGAFYGTNAMLEKMKEQIPTIHVNKKDELQIGKTLQTSLLVSQFPIHENTPEISIKNMEVESEKTKMYYDELEMHPSYRNFGYHINSKRLSEKAPKALVFQGSYMNEYGQKYFQNAFGEYIHVHDYQNVINFPYYFNIFKPECVIFEVAEYVFNDTYFDQKAMKNIEFNPSLENVKKSDGIDSETLQLDSNEITVNKGKAITKLSWNCEEKADYAWVVLDSEYDMVETEQGYETSISTETFEEYEGKIEIVTLKDNQLTYHYIN